MSTPKTPSVGQGDAQTTHTPSNNLIAHLVRIRGIARGYGAEFIWSIDGAAVRLPKRAAWHIADSIFSEFVEAGYVTKTIDSEGLGLVLMQVVDKQTIAFTWGK